LRGEADKRQVSNVKYALQHNIGLGGAAVVGIYKLGFPKTSSSSTSAASKASGGSDLRSTTTKHKSGKFFEDIEDKLKQDSSLVSKINAIIEFSIGLGDNKNISYIVDVKNAPGSVTVNSGGILGKYYFD
jgi:sterol carrier protein 2